MSSREADRPDPLVCSACRNVYDDWSWNTEDQDWQFDGEWWTDPVLPEYVHLGFTCSQHCYMERLKEAVPCSLKSSKGCSCAMHSTSSRTPRS